MLKLSICFTILSFNLFASSVVSSPDCVITHVKEAISSNSVRSKIYSVMSQKRSLNISTALISSEIASLPTSKLLDLRSKKYRQKGIPLLCDDLVDMDKIKPIQDRFLPPNYAPPTITKANIKEIQSELRSSYDLGGMLSLEETAHSYVKAYEDFPDYYCMVRHLLESIRRSAGLSGFYTKSSLDKNLYDSEPISWNFIKNLINVLGVMRSVDSKALLLQEEGLGIICRDIPVIPRANISNL